MFGAIAISDIIAVVLAAVVYAVFNKCGALRPYRAHLDDIYKDFTHYKFRVPVSGAIILDDTHDRVISFFYAHPIMPHSMMFRN